MTEDMKKNILDYITNAITTTEPEERTSFLEDKIINMRAFVSPTSGLLPENYDILEFVNIVSPSDTTANLSLLYGYYRDTITNEYRGIITILGEDFQPIESIFQYDSGTYLRPILSLKQAEDNTFYAIDSDMKNTPTCRFIMLNNFLALSTERYYQIQLRKSYNFPSGYVIDTCYGMFKNPASSHYVLFGSYLNSSYINIMKVIDLKVNVGSANEWNLQSFGSAFDAYQQKGKPVAYFDENDDTNWRFLVRASNNSIKSISKGYGLGEATTITLLNVGSDNYINELFDYDFKNENTVFFSVAEMIGSQSYRKLYKCRIISDLLPSLNELTEVLSITESGLIYTNASLKVSVCNTEVYVCETSATEVKTARLINDSFSNWFFTASRTSNDYTEHFFVKSNFNLVSIVALLGKPTESKDIPTRGYLMKDNYNSLNYNGYSYTAYNSLIPQQGELYSGSSIIFARNLYNFTINDNQSISTIVVPNTYLNEGRYITNQNLLSETKTNMIENENTIQKNIYETLYVNFINAINVINEETNTRYPAAASYITTNINTGTQENVEQTYIGKIRVNKGTDTFIGNITWYPIDSTHKYTEFVVVVDNIITSIDFLSNDETIVYNSIDTSDLETGKTYKISQKLRIE